MIDNQASCIIDSGTSHSILRDKRYFTTIHPSSRLITTIAGLKKLDEGFGPARV